MKKLFLLILSFFPTISYLFPDETVHQQKFVGKYPSVEIEINGTSLLFGIDTGSLKSLITMNGLQKLGIDTTEYLDNQSSFSQEQLDNLLSKAQQENPILNGAKVRNTSRFLSLNIPVLKILSAEISDCTLTYYDNLNTKMLENRNMDGLLGTDILFNLKTLVIDYKNNYITVNTHFVSDKEFKITKKSFETEGITLYDNRYYLDMTLSNFPHEILLDTGNLSECILLTPVTEEEKKEAEINKYDENYATTFIKEGYIENQFLGNFHICYNTIPIKEFGEYIDYRLDNITNYNITSAGYELFKDHIICFNFVNETLGIR